MAEFAGQEKTALDGDSLLMLCYETAAAMSPDADQIGIQPLVAVYLVEKYLLQLVKAKLNFTIVWFEDRAWINLVSKAASSRRFARHVIQSHLRKHCSDIPQAYFTSINSLEWRRWLDLERPYAILATDGASSEQDNKTVETADTYAMAQHVSGGIGVKDMAEGVSVALISNDMFEDHKILVSTAERLWLCSGKELIFLSLSIDYSASLLYLPLSLATPFNCKRKGISAFVAQWKLNEDGMKWEKHPGKQRARRTA